MANIESVIKGLEHCANEQDCRGCPYFSQLYFEKIDGEYNGYRCKCLADAIALLKEQDKMYHALEEDWKAMLKEQEAVEPRVSTAEQRCGHCNKVIEMDGWKVCPWCGKMIDWESWWQKNGTCNQDT